MARARSTITPHTTFEDWGWINPSPVPVTLTDRLRNIGVGESAWIATSAGSAMTVRSTLTRIKRATGATYTTRPHGDGLMVWRLA